MLCIEVLETESQFTSHLQLLAFPALAKSRRPLTSTFGGDTLEYDKLMRFFE